MAFIWKDSAQHKAAIFLGKGKNTTFRKMNNHARRVNHIPAWQLSQGVQELTRPGHAVVGA
jgi:hypothetical protein